MAEDVLLLPEKNQFISADLIVGAVPKGWFLCLECLQYYSDQKKCPMCRGVLGENVDNKFQNKRTVKSIRKEIEISLVGKTLLLPIQVHKMILDFIKLLIVDFPKQYHYPVFYGLFEFLKSCENIKDDLSIYLKIRDKLKRCTSHLKNKSLDGLFLLLFPHICGGKKCFYGIFSLNQFEDKCFQLKKSPRELTNILRSLKRSNFEQR